MPQRTITGLQDLQSLVGQEVGVSDWLTITQEMIDGFSNITGDHQWIHTDVERAKKESPFGTTIAHGFLTLSLMSQLHAQAVKLRQDYKMAINYGFNRIRFPCPVPSGARIRTRSRLQSLEEVSGGLQLVWAMTVEIDGQEKPAVAAEWLTRLYH